jgi:hypothetical protein
MYVLIQELTPLLTSNQGKGAIKGVLLSKTNLETSIPVGQFMTQRVELYVYK